MLATPSDRDEPEEMIEERKEESSKHLDKLKNSEDLIFDEIPESLGREIEEMVRDAKEEDDQILREKNTPKDNLMVFTDEMFRVESYDKESKTLCLEP